LEDFVPELKTLTFQVKLGSFLDKTERIVELTKTLGMGLKCNQSEMDLAERAAHLCKADLATNMVVEMTSLQGIMGRYYALKSGDKPEVAQAIFEHYLPRSADDQLPKTKPGLVVGLADRLDSLIGLFAVGLAPTGTKDPFAQRRAALGICQNLIAWQINFDLGWGLEEAGRGMGLKVSPQDVGACLEFIQGRLRGMLLDLGFRYDVVDAIMAEKGKDPYGAYVACEELTAWVNRVDWDQILPAFSRCVRITRELEVTFTVFEDRFEEPIEKLLYEAVKNTEEAMGDALTVDAFFNAFMPMIPVINRFFDEVLVMVEDEKIRQNRLGMLQRIARLTEEIIDMSFLEGF
jgi:glycyl-tRNA synthetase